MKKSNYNAPAVETLAVRVEAGMQTSGSNTNPNTTQYGEDSWDTPSPNNNSVQFS